MIERVRGIGVAVIDNRWGFLPISIQKFHKTDNRKCQISITNANLKPNHICLLRHGVEVNKLQSFIACIADVFIEYSKTKSTLSIKEMKNQIISSINLDNFLTYQNGNLPSLFFKEREIDIDKYKSSYLYSNIDLTDENKYLFLTKLYTNLTPIPVAPFPLYPYFTFE